ncbi:hypothetical protein [Xinfangfangia pollutisoli]|uniref:hypothetical protein n=1 Tax=Xinfangfangia pollutisoli TaxID=2865960 RepID=UPI001CD5D78C|nr:hypothetical protein [Xinfangfangia pollutisoli]
MTIPAPRTLAEVIARTAEEVARCRSIVLRIEEAVHRLVDAGEIRGERPLAEIQSIDLLDQRLDDLARWLSAIAPLTGAAPLPQPALDALAALRLEELRHALGGRQRNQEDNAGLTELF